MLFRSIENEKSLYKNGDYKKIIISSATIIAIIDIFKEELKPYLYKKPIIILYLFSICIGWYFINDQLKFNKEKKIIKFNNMISDIKYSYIIYKEKDTNSR